MNKGLFITATSTGIGKTIISAVLCCKLIKNKNVTAYYKPVQSGVIYDNTHKRISADCKFLESVLNGAEDFKTYSTYLLNTPASPHYSARLDGVKIDMDEIIADYNKILKISDFVIIEGAGGLYVPLDEDGTLIADIAVNLSVNAILVGFAGLGAINQISLSYFFAGSKKVDVSAIILISNNEEPSDLEIENVRILKKLLNNDNIFIIPAVKNCDTEKNIQGDFFERLENFPDVNKIIEWF